VAEAILYLLRHGESEANAQRVFASRKIDPPLTRAGVRQATMQAEALSSVGLSAIYASPLRRARQTAEIVARRCGLGVTLSEALIEGHVGCLDGEQIDDPEKWAIWESVINQWEQGRFDVAFPGGETLAEVEGRFRRFLSGLGSSQEGPALIVGHGILFLAVIRGMCENRGPGIRDNYMGRGHLSMVSWTGDRLRVLKFNVSPDAAAQEVHVMPIELGGRRCSR